MVLALIILIAILFAVAIGMVIYGYKIERKRQKFRRESKAMGRKYKNNKTNEY